MQSREILAILFGLSLFVGTGVSAQVIDKNYTLDDLVEIYDKPVSNFSKSEVKEIKRRFENITMEEHNYIVDKSIDKEKFKVKPSITAKQELEYYENYKLLNDKFTQEIGKKRLNKDVSAEEVNYKYQEVIKKNPKLVDKINKLSFISGRDSIDGDLSLKNIARFSINEANAFFCRYESNWPNFAKLQSLWTSYSRPYSGQRVRNSPNEWPCDYELLFNPSKKWTSSDGYTWKGYWMINRSGGLSYSHNGSSVIVGYGQAALEGIVGSENVRKEVIMR